MATSSDERPPLPPRPGRRGLWLGILLRLGTLGAAVTLFTLWIFLEADPTWLPALWAAEGLELTLIGYRVHSSPTRLAASVVVALSVAATLDSFADFFPERLFGSAEALV